MKIGEYLLEEPKTLGDCWKIFDKLGFQKPQLPLDDSVFPNAIKLVEINNEVYQENKEEPK